MNTSDNRTEAADQKVENWIAKLIPAYGDHEHSLLRIGEILNEARTELRKQGCWTRFLTSDRLPFSARKAQMLLRICSNFKELDAQTFAQFPQGWSIIHELTVLEPARLKALVT